MLNQSQKDKYYMIPLICQSMSLGTGGKEKRCLAAHPGPGSDCNTARFPMEYVIGLVSAISPD